MRCNVGNARKKVTTISNVMFTRTLPMRSYTTDAFNYYVFVLMFTLCYVVLYGKVT